MNQLLKINLETVKTVKQNLLYIINPRLKSWANLFSKSINRFNGLLITFMILFIPFINAQSSSKMVLIPSGYYEPLFKNDPEEKEKVEKFYLDVYPVTNSEFLGFVKANLKWQRSKIKKIFADVSYLKNWKSDLELGDKISPNSPVTNISWFSAKAYAEWKGKRLPTIAEWEYVILSEKNVKKISEWYSKISPGKIPPVGSTEKNSLGVFDMYGLIWEWTYDFNTSLVTGESRGDGDLERNLFCGNSSSNSKDVENYPAFMRYGYRSSLKANYTTHNLGFRCAKDYN
ncbi:MAG: formylglycine-generating enzyme family protein [Ignavibacteria bacterium]|nr:formylglycine-generating enzyme family protein [Ignavibacteria bacterium]